MRCKPGQDFLPYDRPIAVSKIGSTSVFSYLASDEQGQLMDLIQKARANPM